MVKADLTKDYYADLELTSTATETEIKKQFRQLALKYHPDRNPGRETEVNAKFQTIQYAYEVLTDAEQKGRYDQGRARAGRGGGSAFSQQARPTSGFTKGNPWANAGSNFPPPPSRTNPRTKAHPPPPPPPSAGASRYSNFAGFQPGGFPPPRAKQTDDAEARRKTYEAFSGMRGGGTRAGASSQYAPPPFARTQAPPPPKPAPPPIPKRNGYAPNNAGGDEPPAANTSAYSNRRRAPTAKQEPPPAPPKDQPHADPLRQFKEQAGAPFEPRVSTPYASSGGEKFNPFESSSIGRSNTTRADSKSSGSFGRSTRNRHRSVSPTRDFKNEQQFNESDRTASDANIFNTSPKHPFPRTYNTNHNPGGQARTTPTIDLTSSDESSTEARKYARPRTRRAQDTSTPAKPTPPTYMPNPAADTPGAAPKTDHKMYEFPKPATRLQYLRTSRGNTMGPSSVNPYRGIPSFDQADGLSTPSGASSLRWKPMFADRQYLQTEMSSPAQYAAMNAFEALQYKTLDKLVNKYSSPESGLESRQRQASSKGTGMPSIKVVPESPEMEPSPRPDQRGEVIFVKPTYVIRKSYNAGSAKLSGPRMEEWVKVNGVLQHKITICTKPTWNTWDQFFKFMERTSTDIPFPSFSFSVDGQQYTAHSTPKPFTGASAETINTTFTPEHWEGKFEAGAGYFDGTPIRGNSASSNRTQPRPHANTNARFSSINPEATRQSKSADEAAPSPGAAKFSAEEWAQTFKEPNFFAAPTPGGQKGYPRSGTTRRAKHGSASAKATSGRSSKTASADDDDSDRPLYMGSRPVSKEGPNGSAQPAFANSPNAMDVDDTPAERPARNVHAAPSRAEWRSGEPEFTSAETSPSKPPQRPHQHIEVTEPDLAANFNDLKNTAPFTNPAAGLNSFADLRTDLPFQSKASSNVPFPKRFNSKDLVLPQPPKGPSPPSVPHNATRPAADDWNEYLRKMLIYIKEWSDFNGQMVGHFAARKAQVDGFKQNWLLAMGDGELEVYMDGLKEDEKVRAWWDIAIGKHTKAMEDFVWAKKVFRDGLPEAGRRSEDGGVRIPQKSERLFAEIDA